ncbi:MAG TPA: hypothetical protein VGD06_10350 [Acidobacteriota bacterium]
MNSNHADTTDARDLRRALLPLWIKLFSWMFLVFGGLALVGLVLGWAVERESEFALFGLEATERPYDAIPLLVALLLVAHGVAAYGLLSARSWGVIAGLIVASSGVSVCLVTMAQQGGMPFRGELILEVPFVWKLLRLRREWEGTA